jgi:hypothetical protein
MAVTLVAGANATPAAGVKVAAVQNAAGEDQQVFMQVAHNADVTSTGVNVTTVSSQAVAANPARKGLILQNLSDTRIIGAFSVTPVATAGSESGFSIDPFGSFSWFVNADTRALNVIHAGTGTKRLLVSEW